MTARLTLTDPLGIAEPLRPEVAEAIRLRHADDLRRALDRIPEEHVAIALGQVLAARFGRAKGRRIGEMAGTLAWEV